jgi:hypothetical protein
MQRETFAQFKANELADFPIPKNGNKHRDQIAKLVASILAAKARSAEANTTSIEKQIDRLVYELYRLTKEERAMIEGWGDDKTARNASDPVASLAAL